ncbi:MAG: tail fiber protein [Spirochaetes bacterium]|nr:tail fiber protein [Spirochaetota bacterium]
MQTLSINGSNLTISSGNTVALPTPQMPSGCIMAYGGTTAPSGWLACDGSAVSRTTYAALYAVIGNAYGSGDGSTTFNLPDLRGRFLRGVDGTAGNDPDKATRTASNSGGNTGNNIGSLQTDNNKLHNHNLMVNNTMSGNTTCHTNSYLCSDDSEGGSLWQISTGYLANTVSIANTGGSEARPVNVYVNYIIKY